MRRKPADTRMRDSDASLTKRYGSIGISAVAAAARYQAREEKAPSAERTDDESQDTDKNTGKAKGRTSAPRS